MPWGQVAKAAGQGIAAVTRSMESRSWARLREGRREEALLQAEGASCRNELGQLDEQSA